MAQYQVLGSESTVQQVAPGQTIDSLSTTILVDGNNATATLVLPETWFDTTEGADRLLVFADAIATILNQGKAIDSTPTQTTDPSTGLLVDAVTFTVAYTPPGQAAGQLTRDVTILSSNMGGTGLGTGNVGPTYAEGIIDGVYQSLVALSTSGSG